MFLVTDLGSVGLEVLASSGDSSSQGIELRDGIHLKMQLTWVFHACRRADIKGHVPAGVIDPHIHEKLWLLLGVVAGRMCVEQWWTGVFWGTFVPHFSCIWACKAVMADEVKTSGMRIWVTPLGKLLDVLSWTDGKLEDKHQFSLRDQLPQWGPYLFQ